MRRMFFSLLFLVLLLGPFCPLAVIDAKAAGHGSRMQGMDSMDQDCGHRRLPCCWSASGHGQASGQNVAETVVFQLTASTLIVSDIPVVADLDNSSADFYVQREPHRPKFETVSSNKRE